MPTPDDTSEKRVSRDGDRQEPLFWMPPAPPGEAPPDAVERTEAVSEALARRGEGATPEQLLADIRSRGGPELKADEVAIIRHELIEQAKRPEDREPPSPAGRGRAAARPSAANQPRRATVRIRDVMTKGVECVGPDETVQAAARKMKDLDIGPVPVCGTDDRLAGMLTDRDIAVRAVAAGKDPKECKVREVMTPDVVYCFDDQSVEEAERVMKEKQIRRLLVLNRDRRLVGIVSLGDLATRTGDPEQVGEVLHDVSEPAGARR